MKISIKSIDNPLNVGLFTVSIIIIGLISITFLPIELFPEIETPFVFVTIVYPGASPAEIEYQINKRLEDELKNLDDRKKITSFAAQGVCTIIIEFESNTDPELKRTKVKEAVDKVLPDLPDGIEAPIVQSFDFAKIPVMNVLLHGKNKNYITSKVDSKEVYADLKDIAEKIKEEFELIPHVSKVQIFGGLDREITIAVNPILMWAKKISLTQVIKFFQGGNVDTPGGNLRIDNRDYPIRVLGKFLDIADIKRTILTYRNGKPLYLKDLGEIVDGTAEVKSFARYHDKDHDGSEAISLAIIKSNKSNLLSLSDQIKKKIKMIKSSGQLPYGLDLTVLGDQADEVRIRVNELTTNVTQGIIVVFLVLLFSMGFRNAFIVSVAIPFCMIFTMIGLLIFDETINNVMQFGLILVVGIVVDGAIVVMENVYRHREMGKDKITAAKEGTEEVGTAVVSSVLTTMAAFAPLLFMTGIIGQFMSVVPKTVLFALTGSLIFDHVVIPVLCSKYLKVRDPNRVSLIIKLLRMKGWDKWINDYHPFQTVFKKYQELIRWSLDHRKAVTIIAFTLFLLGMGVMMSLTREAFPEVDLGKLWVEIELPKGSSVEATNEISLQVEEILEEYRKTGMVKSFSASIGSSGVQVFGGGMAGSRNQGPNIARIDVDLVDQEKRDINVNEFNAILRKRILNTCVGAKIKVTKPQGGPPTGAPVNVVITGDDIRVLKRLAKKAKALVKKIPGVIAVEDNYGLGRPEIQIPINRLKAERYGVSVQEIQNMIFILNNGYKISTYLYGQKEFEIRIKLNEEYKKSIGDLKKLTIFSQKLNRPILLTEIVDITLKSGLSHIRREDFKRAIVISGDINRNLRTTTEVSNDVIKTLSDRNIFSLPKGYNIRFRGENEDTDESFEGLKYSFMIGLMIIYFIVVIQLKSFIQPMAIMITVLLSVIGISLGLFLSGNNLGIMAMFGGVSLAGIVVNDAIVLVSYLNILRSKGMSMRDAVIEAGETRLRPILLTTYTTAGGLLPLALALGGARTFWSPMGWAIIGGLLVATFQTLIVVPIAYSILDDIKVKMTNCLSKENLKPKLDNLLNYVLKHIKK